MYRYSTTALTHKIIGRWRLTADKLRNGGVFMIQLPANLRTNHAGYNISVVCTPSIQNCPDPIIKLH
jgi:ABC-type antimicrobial peptide transport system ATPase subunit